MAKAKNKKDAPAPVETEAPKKTLDDQINFLKNQVRYNGHGELVEKEVEEKMRNLKKGENSFTVESKKEYQRPGVSEPDKFGATLHFERGKGKYADDMFYNRYDASLTRVVTDDKGKPEIQHREHTFYINKTGTITEKEAYNLMSDRAVYKKGITSQDKEKPPYNAWVQLDYKNPVDGKPGRNTFGDNYGFDLEASVRTLNLKELRSDKFTASLIQSLEKGNLQSATLVGKNDEERKIFIEANPQYKNVKPYNEDGTKMYVQNNSKMKV